MKRVGLGFIRAAILMACVSCNGALRFDDEADGGAPPLLDASARADADATSTAAHDAAMEATTRAPCTSDIDCPVESLHCDVTTGGCVACTTDAQCTAAGFPRCDAALHSCVACGADVDCPAGYVCEPTSRQCVKTCAEGPTEHDCPASAPTCNEKQMFCVSCSSDAECASITDDGDFCNLSNGRCVDCISDAQCDPDRPRCDSTHGSCVECLTSADCSGADYCDPDRLKCL